MAKQTKPNTLNLSGKYTGRYLMILPEASTTSVSIKSIQKSTGLKVASSKDFKTSSFTDSEIPDGIILHHLGVAILNTKGDHSMMSILSTNKTIGVQSGSRFEQERVVHATETVDYKKGYNAALKEVKSKFGIDTLDVASPVFGHYAQLIKSNTWGLLKTRVVVDEPYKQKYTGKNSKICILDTGIDFKHQDFIGRTIVSQSFVTGEEVQDLHGHGTHCAGTAVGILKPTGSDIQRYSIAYDANLYVGKVLNNKGSGADGWILAGINWAMANKCDVISMSLGADTDNEEYSKVYEAAAKQVLESKSLIIAAAGNSYPESPAVNHPANCPSIMAVGAVNESLSKASFSCIGKFPPSGKVDIAAPGVNILSAASTPHKGLTDEIAASQKYGNLDGTSMATPHVAGIAALYVQKRKTTRGHALWQKLTSSALPLSQPVTHVGSGLVQAPYSEIKKKTN